MKVTLCDKVLVGDIKTVDFKSNDTALDYIYDWLSFKADEFSGIDYKYPESVFVCFPSYEGLPNGELRNEHSAFLITHLWQNITDFADQYIEGMPDDLDSYSFNIFEFENYQEAFAYCADLKESF